MKTAVKRRKLNVVDDNSATLQELRSLSTALSRSQAMIEFTPSGEILSANENFLKAFGYSLEEVKGRHHSMFCEPDSVNTFEYAQFWKKLGNGEFESGEFRRIGKGGREVWIIGSYNPVLGPDGKPQKIVKLATDISRSKAELQARTDIMNMTSIVSESDLKGNILSVNEKFIEVSKYRRDELIGHPHNTTRHPDMPKEVFKELWATIGRGKLFRGTIKNRAKDGQPYYVDAVIAPILGENGKPAKYLGVRYDITDSELERQNMRGTFAAIDSVYAYIEFDTQGNVLKANKIFQQLTGYSEADLAGKHHRIFCSPLVTNSTTYAHHWSDLAAGKSQSGMFSRVSRSGQELWLQAVYAPVKDETGRVVKIVKIATDVTEQRSKNAMYVDLLSETVNSVTAAAAELTATAAQMSSNTKRTSDEAILASKASEDVAEGVDTMATNTEEMVASIKEISRSANESAEMSRTASTRAQETNSTVSQLGASSQEIGEVIKVISSIAQQTNLLALNATIEAARAGDAGKGFAVVANEVKELAKQTAKATQDITNKIGAIQKDSQRAVEAIGGIAQAVDKLSSISGTIAAAVEEQTATTNEVSRVVQQASKSVQGISNNIRSVSHAAEEGSISASQTLDASKGLTDLAEKLKEVVEKLKSA
jgi:methyl-accepting chemotaxis protein